MLFEIRAVDLGNDIVAKLIGLLRFIRKKLGSGLIDAYSVNKKRVAIIAVFGSAFGAIVELVLISITRKFRKEKQIVPDARVALGKLVFVGHNFATPIKRGVDIGFIYCYVIIFLRISEAVLFKGNIIENLKYRIRIFIVQVVADFVRALVFGAFGAKCEEAFEVILIVVVYERQPFIDAHDVAAGAVYRSHIKKSFDVTLSISGDEITGGMIEGMAIGAENGVGDFFILGEFNFKRQAFIVFNFLRKTFNVAFIVFFYDTSVAGEPQVCLDLIALGNTFEKFSILIFRAKNIRFIKIKENNGQNNR